MIKHVVAVQLDQVEGVEEDDNGRWNGCCDKIRFCYLSAEGAGKPTSPYSTLISLVRGRPAPDCARVGFWERSGNLVLDRSTTGFDPLQTQGLR
jgi:hypothetical protein